MAMKEKYTIIDKLMIALIVLFSFYYLEPFFIWETFAGGVFRNLFGAIPFRTLFGFGIIVLWLAFYSKKGIKRSKIRLAGSIFFIAIFTVCLAGGSERTQILSLAWLPYFVVASYILLPEKIQRKSYNVFVTIFAVTLILPILWYILTHLGFRIPYSILESYEEIKVIRGKFYKLYPLATQITSRWDPLYQELHLCGIYDEAGRVGTLAGLVLVSEKYRLKGNWKNIIILIAGILSFSLAFYAIAVVYYLVSCFDKKKYKNIAIILGIIVVYFVFMSVDFDDPNIRIWQGRFQITSEGLSGNNRTNADFDALMDDFYHSDTYSILFGKGDGAIGEIQTARNIDGSSYKCMIYNFGFVGYGLSILWLVLYAVHMCKIKGANKTQIIAVLSVYLANMYQRPSVFYMGYMLIFFGGIVIASQEKIGAKQVVVQRKRRRSIFRVRRSSAFGNIQR